MITRSFNPIERGQPALWIEGILAAGRAASCARVKWKLNEYPDDQLVDVVIDTPGGNCAESLRVFNALRDDPREKRITIVRAHSGGALVAMAGNQRRIVVDGTVYLHPPGGRGGPILEAVNIGHATAADLRGWADRLDATNELHLDIYQRGTGQPRDLLRKLITEDTTLDAATAVELGFADNIVETK